MSKRQLTRFQGPAIEITIPALPCKIVEGARGNADDVIPTVDPHLFVWQYTGRNTKLQSSNDTRKKVTVQSCPSGVRNNDRMALTRKIIIPERSDDVTVSVPKPLEP